LALPSGDLMAPEVQHEVSGVPVKAGHSLRINVTATDNVGVKSVILFYRAIGENNYNRVLMQRNALSDEYSVDLGEEKINYPGLEYYIQAEDLAGNTLLHGYSFSPLIVKVLDAEGSESTGVATAVGQKSTTSTTSLFYNKWLWIGAGVVAAAALASSGSDSGGNNSGNTNPTGGLSATVEASTP
jgi:hypothetical protein